MGTRTVSSPDDLDAHRDSQEECDHLFVVLSCVAPHDLPSRHGLEQVREVKIGRADVRSAERRGGGRELNLRLADPHVSKSHARLTRCADGWELCDLGSKNGTFVDGESIRARVLADGDWIQIGHTLLRLRTRVPTPSDAPEDLVATGRVPAFATLLPSLAHEFGRLAAAAASSVPVLLVSETGTGKELLARAIHDLSGRSSDLVPVHCGALPPTLIDSVLFGHKRGAFSGAVGDHAGLFRAASGGTLFLDEVGDMPLEAQVAVLRALQEGEILPVGSTRPVRVDARLVAATHRDLESLAKQGRFREDLLARLTGFPFRLPPLRERREDIGLLTAVLLRRRDEGASKPIELSPEVGLRLARYAWPRNVRELERFLWHAQAIAGAGRIEVNALPPALHADSAAPSSSVCRDHQGRLASALVEGRGNVSYAAQALGTSRSQIRRMLKRAGLDAGSFRR